MLTRIKTLVISMALAAMPVIVLVAEAAPRVKR